MAEQTPPAERVSALDPDPRWAEVADRLHLLSPADALWGQDEQGRDVFLPGAELNLSVTCLDAHLADHGDEATQKEFAPLIDNWVAEINDPAVRSLTRMHLQELAEGKRDLYL